MRVMMTLKLRARWLGQPFKLELRLVQVSAESADEHSRLIL